MQPVGPVQRVDRIHRFMSVENPRHFVYEYEIYIKYIIFVYEYALVLTLTLTLTINPNLSVRNSRYFVYEYDIYIYITFISFTSMRYIQKLLFRE